LLAGGTTPEKTEEKGVSVNEIMIVDPETLELDLNHGRIDKLQNLEPLTQIERLYLRWNLITKIENLDTLVTLRELELYDNQIVKMENLDALVNLE
jgi:protein phosphatase 1 regulatory subunit 7